MKNHLFNLLSSVIAFYIPFQLALLTDLILVKNLVILIFCVQWISFIPAYYFQTEKFFDLMGSVTYISIILSTIYITGTDKIADYIIVGCVAVWAIRLGSFLFMRIHKAGEDRRFRTIKINFTRFLMTWTLQGMWVSLCSMCALTAINTGRLEVMNIFFIIGACIFIAGLYIEIKADNQKSRFRSIPENRDRFITDGLWSRSRHPNYFGEVLLWSGIAVMSVSALEGLQYITLISPIFTYLLLVHVSGVRMLEARADIKWGQDPEYKNYVEKTPMLFPKL